MPRNSRRALTRVSVLLVTMLIATNCSAKKDSNMTINDEENENIIPGDIVIEKFAVQLELLGHRMPYDCQRAIGLGIRNIAGNFADTGRVDGYASRTSEGTIDCPYNIAVHAVGTPTDPNKCFDIEYYMLPVEIKEEIDRYGRSYGTIAVPLFHAGRLQDSLRVCRAGRELNAWRLEPTGDRQRLPEPKLPSQS